MYRARVCADSLLPAHVGSLGPFFIFSMRARLFPKIRIEEHSEIRITHSQLDTSACAPSTKTHARDAAETYFYECGKTICEMETRAKSQHHII